MLMRSKFNQPINHIDISKGQIPAEKRFFLNYIGFFLSAREEDLNNLNSKIFPTKRPGKIPTSQAASEQTSESTVFDTPKLKKEWDKKFLPKVYGN